MTRNEHIEAHNQLHRSLDLLLADFLMHNPGKLPSNTALIEFMRWSYRQTIEPDMREGDVYEDPTLEGHKP